jgi:hypothetical protein
VTLDLTSPLLDSNNFFNPVTFHSKVVVVASRVLLVSMIDVDTGGGGEPASDKGRNVPVLAPVGLCTS